MLADRGSRLTDRGLRLTDRGLRLADLALRLTGQITIRGPREEPQTPNPGYTAKRLQDSDGLPPDGER